MKATLVYSIARVGVFAVAFGILYVVLQNYWLAALIAALATFLFSYIFFGTLRNRVALAIVERRRAPERDEDADLEDSVVDAGPAAAYTPSASGFTSQAPRPESRRAGPPPEDD